MRPGPSNCCITFYCLTLLVFFGCSKPAHPPPQISTADRIVVATNQIHALNLAVTGDEASKVVKALAASKEDKASYSAMFDWDLQLYAGTNLLTVVHFQDRIFMLGNTQYVDNTGVLAAFYKKLESEEESRR